MVSVLVICLAWWKWLRFKTRLDSIWILYSEQWFQHLPHCRCRPWILISHLPYCHSLTVFLNLELRCLFISGHHTRPRCLILVRAILVQLRFLYYFAHCWFVLFFKSWLDLQCTNLCLIMSLKLSFIHFYHSSGYEK